LRPRSRSVDLDCCTEPTSRRRAENALLRLRGHSQLGDFDHLCGDESQANQGLPAKPAPTLQDHRRHPVASRPPAISHCFGGFSDISAKSGGAKFRLRINGPGFQIPRGARKTRIDLHKRFASDTHSEAEWGSAAVKRHA
jgi:hypothetical protein